MFSNCLSMFFDRSIVLILLIVVCCYNGAYYCNLEEDYYPDKGARCGKVPVNKLMGENAVWPPSFACSDDVYGTTPAPVTVGPPVTDPPDVEEVFTRAPSEKNPPGNHERDDKHKHKHNRKHKHAHQHHHNGTYEQLKGEKKDVTTTKMPRKMGDRKKRMAYGMSSVPGSFPSYVHIVKRLGKVVFECGAVLMSETTILTTATCLTSDGSGVDWRLRLNDIALVFAATRAKVEAVVKGKDPNPKRSIWRACAHPKSRSTHGWMTGELDLALLILNDKITLTGTTQPACLPIMRSMEEIQEGYEGPLYLAELGYKNSTHFSRNLKFTKAEQTRCPWLEQETKGHRSLCFKSTDGNACGLQGSPLYTREMDYRKKALGPMRLAGLMTLSQDQEATCNRTKQGIFKATDIIYMHSHDKLLNDLWITCPMGPGIKPSWAEKLNETSLEWSRRLEEVGKKLSYR